MSIASNSRNANSFTHSAKRKRAADSLLNDDLYIPSSEEIAALPDPAPILQAIATSVVEVISGVRSVDQIASLVSAQVYDRLRQKVAQRAQLDAQSQRPKLAPKFAVRKVHQESPRPGIIESVVLLSNAVRTRAVTIRLEPMNKRWRATDISIL
jgi:hypothetical protein